MSRVGYQRHSRVTHQRDFRALLHGHHQFRRARQFVVLVVADQRLANAVVREQLLRVARVFARDLIGFFEDAQSAQRDVLQVADRRPHKVQTARGSLWLSGRIVGGHGDQSSMRGSARAPAAGRSLYKNAAASRQAL